MSGRSADLVACGFSLHFIRALDSRSPPEARRASLLSMAEVYLKLRASAHKNSRGPGSIQI